jgi:hypothetical protein
MLLFLDAFRSQSNTFYSTSVNVYVIREVLP